MLNFYPTPDAEDRTTRSDFGTGPGQSATYATESYNGLGARFFRHDGFGHDHNMAYDGTAPGAAALYDSYGQTLYTPGIAQTSYASGQTLYTNVDALGSVHDTQTNGNATQDALRTDAFGGTVARQGSDTLSLGFAASSSYQTDGDTGLMLLGNRYYDPSTGRFMSQDPAKAGDNWYAYCGNDPLDGLDPTGLSSTDPDITVDGIDLGNDDVAQRIGSFINTSNRDHETDSEIGAYWAVNNVNLKGFTSEQEQTIMDDLETIEFSPRGAELLGDSKFLHTTLNIDYYHDANPADGDLYANSFYYKPGGQVGSYYFAPDTIQFDPSLQMRVDTTNGLGDEPSVVIIEHELGHDVTGFGDSDMPGSGGGPNIINNENPFREWLGLPRRTSHNGTGYGPNQNIFFFPP